MKTTTLNNAEIVIQANMNKEGEFDKVMKVAELMVANNEGAFDIASADECEGWVHVCAVWSHYQAKEIRDEYNVAKKAA